MKKIFLFVLAIAFLSAPAFARDSVRAVGSSTVYPFATVVAEELGKSGEFNNVVVESTGTGAGIKLFCAGVGQDYPDIANASRKMKDSEFESCEKNGVNKMTEVKFGYDGIVMAHAKNQKPVDFTLKQIWLALAKQVPDASGKMIENPYKKWSEIDESLPAIKIEVLGPPPSSGTRDSFVELAMEGGCKEFPAIKKLKETDEKSFKSTCHTLREDGAFIEAGENDNLIVQKLEANPNAFGVFGYSFLEQNTDKLRGSKINGTEPNIAQISSGKYPIARSMYFYVKNAHIGIVPGLKEYVAEFVSERAFGDNGYLVAKGLIPLSKVERKQVREQALNAKELSM